MAFWKRNQGWEDQYDEYYAQDRRFEPSGGQKSTLFYVSHVLTLATVGVLLMGSVGAINGRTMVEKMLTDLLMPVGLVWLILLALIYFSLLLRQTWPALTGLICWLVLSLAGNAYVSNWLVSTLESPYQQINVFEMEPLEILVVLGGGTSSRLSGRAQLSGGGDRVALAARLYLAGLAKQIICTGSQSTRASELDLDPKAEAAEILQDLGVPPAAITQMKGINTFEEMRNLKTILDQTPNPDRVGLLTSAYHLSRAIRLANSNGIEVVPVPADFLTMPYGPSPNVIIPSSEPMEVTRRALKEYFARFIGR